MEIETSNQPITKKRVNLFPCENSQYVMFSISDFCYKKVECFFLFMLVSEKRLLAKNKD